MVKKMNSGVSRSASIAPGYKCRGPGFDLRLHHKIKMRFSVPSRFTPVSYTHLDVYKRQPLEWKRGVITNVFPGQDSLVRVAEVRTALGILRRPIHKLCPLPVATN